MVILDTSILIDHLRLKGKSSALVRLAEKYSKNQFAISVISIQELYEGKSTRNHEAEKNLLGMISPLKILPYTYEIAKLAGEITRDQTSPADLADAAIAATAITYGAQLATLDKNDFANIPNLEII